MSHDLEPLQHRLGYTFANSELLLTALTHRSFIEEQHPGGQAPLYRAQDRLALVGDAWLRAWFVTYLVAEFTTVEVGDLTKIVGEFLSNEAMVGPAESLGLMKLLRLGRGAAVQREAARKHHGTTLEAVIGAMVADGGEQAAKALFVELVNTRSWQPAKPEGDPTPLWIEWHQRTFRRSPEPGLANSWGPDHARTFSVTLSIELGTEPIEVLGEGRSKKEASRDAARQMIDELRARGEVV